MDPWTKRLGSLAIGAAVAAPASTAFATKAVDVYSVYWSSDLTDKPQIEQFMGCLTEASTFGGSWAGEWGVGPVHYHGAYVIPSAAPNPLRVGGSLENAINAAITAGILPQPGTGYDTIYLAHGPHGVTCEGADGTAMCATFACGEHGPATWNGRSYQEALVPLDCNLCGGTLKTATWIGEHEVGEALGWLGVGGFENGDNCEAAANLTQLSCCGTHYTIQQMAKPSGASNCETINAMGAQCGCGPAQIDCTKPSDCCAGLSCQTWVGNIGDTPKNVCCYESGQACANTNDCCGGLACKSGKCACEPVGAFCLRDIDCCNGGVCTNQKCAVNPATSAASSGSTSSATTGSTAATGAGGATSAGVTGAGGASGSGGSASSPPRKSGCSCALPDGTPSAGAWILAVGAGAALTRRRRARRA